jgi:hypothetical protein
MRVELCRPRQVHRNRNSGTGIQYRDHRSRSSRMSCAGSGNDTLLKVIGSECIRASNVIRRDFGSSSS